MPPKARAHLLLPGPEQKELEGRVLTLEEAFKGMALIVRGYDRQIDNLLSHVNVPLEIHNHNFAAVAVWQEQAEAHLAKICEQVGLGPPRWERPDLPNGFEYPGSPTTDSDGTTAGAGEDDDVTESEGGPGYLLDLFEGSEQPAGEHPVASEDPVSDGEPVNR